MPPVSDYLRTDAAMEKKLLEYIEQTSANASSWWHESYIGTTETRASRLDRYRKRYEARRSVASLMSDAKTLPFRGASNVGVGMEQIMGEWLIANSLANTVDLDPPLDVYDPTTGQTDHLVQTFYRDRYVQQLQMRTIYETLLREVFQTGTTISKWESWSAKHSRERVAWVLFDPQTHEPLMVPGENGKPTPIEADPETPLERLPLTPSGQRVKVGRISSIDHEMSGWQPRFRVRAVEQIKAPPTATTQDPNDWDFVHEEYIVNAWWFLSRQGEMYEGKIPKARLEQLWRVLGVSPEEAWRRPNGQLVQPVKVRESHLKFPASASGEPVELVVQSLPEHHFILSWRMTRLPRRPYFVHQVWHRTNHWMGVGIPETLFSLRNAMDALLNQDLDAGNLYNQPPLLISSLAGLNDETFEMAGPGAVWYLRDINGVKFLPPPIRSRDPITMLNWLVSMAQRLWGVTDLNLNAPTSSLSPNIRTATGATLVTQQAMVKFGHFIRNIESVRSLELALMHVLHRELWNGNEVVRDENGQPTTLTKARLYEYLQVRAVGDGLLSNPILRQQRLQELAITHAEMKNPVIYGDPEVLFELTKQLNEGSGVHLPIKPPKELQDMRLALALTKTPSVQRVLPQGMQELQGMLAQEQATEKSNGRADAVVA